ncbi:MAG: glucuronate isomerase [Flavicella sp.]|nr:glucuronate isomerase [Flavicella sp.]
MRQLYTNTFITKNFLLESKEAEILYHEYAKDMPIIDYHNHLSAQQIANNKPIGNITEAWLQGDHYKWRAMRANGIDESFVTGNSDYKEKFLKWAETVPKTLRNPLFHWTHLELKRYFNIDTILQPSTAEEIYNKTNAVLEHKTPAQLLEDMKVEVVCTTDDLTDNLKYHQQIAQSDISIKVFPTFRSDALFLIEQDSFITYNEKLASCSSLSTDNFKDFLKAIDSRIDFFHNNGCRLSDYGVGGEFYSIDCTKKEADLIFSKRLKDNSLTLLEIKKYRSFISFYLAEKYHEKNWVQQYHFGAIRNNNKRLLETVGADIGCDSIGDYSFADAMSKFFNELDYNKKLAKTITYNLDVSNNEVFASMMGNFNDGSIAGKMQFGAAWWYLDQKDGIEKQLNTLSNIGFLSNFIGMLTDSRSFLSFPRHEYFRRILCNMIADDINKGLLPNDMNFLGSMIQDVCYNNAKNYFKFN